MRNNRIKTLGVGRLATQCRGESGFLTASSPTPTWKMGRREREAKGQGQGQGLGREGGEGGEGRDGRGREGREEGLPQSEGSNRLSRKSQ